MTIMSAGQLVFLCVGILSAAVAITVAVMLPRDRKAPNPRDDNPPDPYVN